MPCQPGAELHATRRPRGAWALPRLASALCRGARPTFEAVKGRSSGEMGGGVGGGAPRSGLT